MIIAIVLEHYQFFRVIPDISLKLPVTYNSLVDDTFVNRNQTFIFFPYLIP